MLIVNCQNCIPGIQGQFLKSRFTLLTLACIIIYLATVGAKAQSPAIDSSFPYKTMPQTLPRTKPLSSTGDLSIKMLEGAHKFIDQKITESVASRERLWNRDFRSREAYEKSIEPNRRRFM